jgi:hypothetical protein
MANDLIRRLRLASSRALSGKAASNERRTDIPAITEDEVAEARAFFPTEKYFIFGHARSGTTLLTRLIRLHPNVHCNYQAHFFTRAPLLESLVADPEVGSWLARRSNRWNRGKDLSPIVLRAVSDFIMERDARQVGKAGPGFRVGDKSPNSLLNGQAVHLMMKVYPDARLVFIIRDGRDAVLSHRLQSFIDTPQSLSPEDLRIREEFTRNPEPFLSGQRSLFLEKNLRYEAQRWVENVTQTDQAGRQLLGERYCHLRYEDLLAYPWEQMCRVWSFLDVEITIEGLRQVLDEEMQRNPDADWQQQKAGGMASGIQKGRRGNWQNVFSPRDRKIFQEVAGQTLKDWGYETD